ncbi:RNA ligase [Streptomyces goshikiensis]|uniref:RNA ligase n=1 Tax=Streptomyces goshikiensis TaxID=1942 RepID=UPI00368585A2
MTLLDTLFAPGDLQDAITAGHVVRTEHPDLPLALFSYTRACQYSSAWTAVTTRCRGLIVDERTGAVVAWPFEKFFNTAEHNLGRPYAPPLPDEPFRVYDKVDGSLGIVFFFGGRWHAATRGAFSSREAQWAQRWLDAGDTTGLRPGTTYLAEIVFPGNRVVVDYRGRTDLVLLAAFGSDGAELDLDVAAGHWRGVGSVVRSWPAMELAELIANTEANRSADGSPLSGLDSEGYVLRFNSGMRAKAKLTEYVLMHRTVSGTTERTVWRHLGVAKFHALPAKAVARAVRCSESEVVRLAATASGPLEVLLAGVPDEFDAWVRDVVARLEAEFDETTEVIKEAFARQCHLVGDREAFATAARAYPPLIRSALFLLRDGADIGLHLWNGIQPRPADA